MMGYYSANFPIVAAMYPNSLKRILWILNAFSKYCWEYENSLSFLDQHESFSSYILQVEVFLPLYSKGNLQEMLPLWKNYARLYQRMLSKFCKGSKSFISYQPSKRYIVLLLEVCENPMLLMMDFSEFLFAPFGNNLISHSLYKKLWTKMTSYHPCSTYSIL